MEVLRGRDGRDGRDGEKGRWVHQEHRERGEWQVHMGHLGRRVCMETKVCEEFKENKVCKDFKETQVCEELKERQDCRVHQQEEQPTLAGAVPPAPLTRELHSSTLEELEGHAMTTQEEQQTICVYQMILTISSTRVECKDVVLLVG